MVLMCNIKYILTSTREMSEVQCVMMNDQTFGIIFGILGIVAECRNPFLCFCLRCSVIYNGKLID